MVNWDVINLSRIRTGPYASDDSYGFNGAFRIWIDRHPFIVIISDGMGWEHVSVSDDINPKRCPKWETMCMIKQMFWGDDVTVVQFHPKKAQYVNFHPGCLHMWRPTDPAKQIELPPSIMVGPKKKVL